MAPPLSSLDDEPARHDPPSPRHDHKCILLYYSTLPLCFTRRCINYTITILTVTSASMFSVAARHTSVRASAQPRLAVATSHARPLSSGLAHLPGMCSCQAASKQTQSLPLAVGILPSCRREMRELERIFARSCARGRRRAGTRAADGTVQHAAWRQYSTVQYCAQWYCSKIVSYIHLLLTAAS